MEDVLGHLLRQGRWRDAGTVDTSDKCEEILDTLDKEDLADREVLEDPECLVDLVKPGLLALEDLEDLADLEDQRDLVDQRDHHHLVDLDNR